MTCLLPMHIQIVMKHSTVHLLVVIDTKLGSKQPIDYGELQNSCNRKIQD